MSALALGGAGLSLVLVRLGWGGRRELAAAGWLLGLASLLALTMAHGAWGLAMGAVAAMAAALIIVLQAGWVSPAGRARKAGSAPSVTLPHSWAGTGRRLAVFALTVPVSLAASVWFAYGLNALMTGGGAQDADSVATVFFGQPLAWAVLMSWQMTQTGPRAMTLPPLLATISGTLLWIIA
ncbi:MAG TPA: hypothetical protein VFS87_04220 [Qipengyuania sp.]|nr:hypothetical protein [Qipengyuania sp.]